MIAAIDSAESALGVAESYRGSLTDTHRHRRKVGVTSRCLQLAV